MKINHVIPSLSALSGGPARSVPLACSALSAHAEIEISTLQSADQVTVPINVPVHAFPGTFCPLPLAASSALRAYLFSADYDILHAHGLWQFPTHYAVAACRRRNKPLVITPRGMLEPGALQFSRWKKHVSGWLWQNRDLHRATCIHVTSQMEADNCRRYGLTNPVALVPNGIDVSEYPLKSADPSGRSQKRKLLFLSRIHPKKGLVYLLEAWAQLPRFHEEWQLVIAGNDDGGHEVELKRLASRLGLDWSEEPSTRPAGSDLEREASAPSVLHFAGPLFGERKAEAYHDADLFVLPTLSENFGMVVPEALACGIPVITTRGAPWRELRETDSGWWIDVGTAPLKRCLEEALVRPSEELLQMGCRGRQLVLARYSIASVAQEMMSVYKWCLSRQDPPACLLEGGASA
jgi:glycosyltransferase involved in cell wall biosynthesis